MPFYTPGATEEEMKRMFAVAAEVPGAAGYVHLRYAGLGRTASRARCRRSKRC